MTTILKYQYNVQPNGKFLHWKGVNFYAPDSFYPKDYFSGETQITENTFGFHHFDSSWQEDKEKKKMFDTSWDEGTLNKKKMKFVSFKNFFRGLSIKMLYVRIYWRIKKFKRRGMKKRS